MSHMHPGHEARRYLLRAVAPHQVVPPCHISLTHRSRQSDPYPLLSPKIRFCLRACLGCLVAKLQWSHPPAVAPTDHSKPCFNCPKHSSRPSPAATAVAPSPFPHLIRIPLLAGPGTCQMDSGESERALAATATNAKIAPPPRHPDDVAFCS